MKNKTFACVMGLVLALSLTACGEEEVIVENTNEEVSVEVQTQEATEAPTETVAETGTEAEGGPLLQVAVMEIPDLSGTEWNFAGGMIDGTEMTEDEYNTVLSSTYGGQLSFVFDGNGNVQMVQGGGSLNGTYEGRDDGLVAVVFDNNGSNLIYACFFTDMDGLTMIALSDDTGDNGVYFVQQ